MKRNLLAILLLFTGVCSAQQKGRTASAIMQHFLHPDGKYVLVAAHRGDWRNAPENSIHALQLCIQMGVDIMETDVRKTKDGVLVLMHDDRIDRTTSGKGLVKELTWDSLQHVTLRQGHGGPTEEHIPTFEAFMQAVKGKPILINLDKGWDIIPEMYAILKKTGTVEQALFKGNLPLAQLRQQFGNVMDSIHYMPMVHPSDYSADKTGAERPDSLIAGFYDHYRPAGFELVFDKEQSPVITEALPAVARHHTTVWLNSLWPSQCAGHDDEKAMINANANWGWLIKAGANTIQTDRPQELLAYLRASKMHD
ncbi:glycerophosphoryl diester phosphodiesterase [Filimonas lacunae]|uniref:Glycerophosphoryl diester phosphodiesterase n=1 Tax=Filimonas lacunae TaxID=477680 RepID=A0A173MGP1_9BACT|nr:glycerophosphodiester phosphodiesterase family protein [Filimonas lacunae]BAV06666.1 glycerophosphoryl diester phosphodiesterase [Filimonas lacunae]SIT27825.1 glycerophosphoryl diester phosphodiesterase [Filimonas lacunae]